MRKFLSKTSVVSAIILMAVGNVGAENRTTESSPQAGAAASSPGQIQKTLQATQRLILDLKSQVDDPTFYDSMLAETDADLAFIENALQKSNLENPTEWETLAKIHVSALARQRYVALSNPLLDFDRLLLVKRSVSSPALGLPQNWQSNCALPDTGFDDEIIVMDLAKGDSSQNDPTSALPLKTLYRPEGSHFVGDVDLHFDADRLLFSSIGKDHQWHVFEIKVDGTGLRQVTPSLPGVDHYDACYLPDDAILFSSTACITSVPCVNGSTNVANLYRIEPDGAIRQLCFDQEHNWCPTVMPNGRVMYLRWEYTDTPHSHTRILFQMNPDGTAQMEYYGSNSYWPNAMFYARPIPDSPGKFVAVVGGHHGVPRMGELVLFDVARGRREASGAVQRIPGFGKPVCSETDPKYESTLIQDQLVDASWPKFLHPYPLSDKYFLVACKPTPDSLWGIYLVDVFDNMTLLREEPGYALLEPIPFRPTEKPPVIPSRIDPTSKEAIVYLSDIYKGDGLKGIPRGSVKQLRLISYNYLYSVGKGGSIGGPQGVVGMEGPWDVRRILGTVPVKPDGSVAFRVPANTPIALQPLDSEGKALQLMRSWFTAMPGEVLSCVGCHEDQNSTPPNSSSFNFRDIAEIKPWHGPARGFSFPREVQPVLDKYCIGCHDGQGDGISAPGRLAAFDLRGKEMINDYTSVYHHGGRDAGHFSTSYVALHRFVRRPGMESDYHLLTPMEFHADTTQLVQMLSKGHHGVRLDEEAWDRLVTWIDLNTPYHGTWIEIAGEERVAPAAARRHEFLKKYANVDVDPEAIIETIRSPEKPILPDPPQEPTAVTSPVCEDWPFDSTEAKGRQESLGVHEKTIDLGEGVTLKMVKIPAGKFVLGDNQGEPDEDPERIVSIDRPFWMATCETTNAQFERFDAKHDSGVESRFSFQFGVRGFYVNKPEQPVVRVSWDQATAFCQWLSEKIGKKFELPSEAQWEYACRAGTDTPFFYGNEDTDFAPFANLADQTLSEFVCDCYMKKRTPLVSSKYDDWIPKDVRFNDGGFLSDGVGLYKPNAWGLFDMHGNVAEWTDSSYDSALTNDTSPEKKVVRGGSWRDRPLRARSSFRLGYPTYQRIYNVGFRVIQFEE